MIVYTMTCAKDHTFDEWFDSMADYERRKAKRKIACPECGGRKVEKALMAPSIGRGGAAPAPACGVPTCGAAAAGACPMAKAG